MPPTTNMNETYTPKPIDTSNVKLPASLQQLIEKLAANTHEVWAAGRIKDGWACGKTRDDENKTHPCLVPYEDLPESEKEYDRNTATEALKAVLCFGYDISEKEGGR